ncbi:MAG TPA: DHH family phosphoesterase [Desulfobacterales bacterium]|nr:DHH family phosphoesterase [Desulfobacterales bacterium]
MIDKLIEDMELAIRSIRKWPGKKIQLFHHNDSDGLCSGAILQKAFERAGYDVNRFSLEKPYPAVLKKIYEQDGRVLVFADFAGRIAPMISDFNQGRNLTLILDHHVAEASTDPNVFNLDPELYGLKGDRDITASTTCYFFGLAMDPVNRDMAHIAAIGAVGDKFFENGRLVSQNREVVMEAVKQDRIEIREHETGEDYYLISEGGPLPCDQLGDYLDTLGAAGFYQNGPDIGIKVCHEGISPASDRMVEELRVIQIKAFDEEIKRIRNGGLKKTRRIQWFHVKNRFSPMGVKMVGAFCDNIKNTDDFDPHRYIAGFQIIPNEIPGFGPIPMDEVKISMRVSVSMEEKIRSGKTMALNILLPEATARVGGFSDACHSLTAATTVAIGKEVALIDEMEKILTL